jgi:hypothetical protein
MCFSMPLTFSSCTWGPLDPSEHLLNHIVLHHLKDSHLTIVDAQDGVANYFEEILNHITAPSLTSLVLRNISDMSYHISSKDIVQFQQQSSFSLCHLEIYDMLLSPADMVKLLRVLPRLTHLAYDDPKGVYAQNSVLESMSKLDQEFKLVPKLESLEFVVHHSTFFDQTMLCRVILDGIGVLQTVTINLIDGNFDSKAVALANQLERRGMQILLNSQTGLLE